MSRRRAFLSSPLRAVSGPVLASSAPASGAGRGGGRPGPAATGGADAGRWIASPGRDHALRLSVAFFCLLAAPGALLGREAPAPRILVAPNVLVSRDGDFAHCETAIAASPKDVKNLVGAATTLSRPPDGSFMNRTYASHDGGWTWTAAVLPIEIEQGGGDPQVGYALDGAALFVGIGSYGMAVHRSEDGGRTWEKPALVRFSDHEQLAVDHTSGRFAGRVYIAGEIAKDPSTAERRSAVGLWRSDDGGRSFIGPVEVADAAGRGLAAHPLAILSDGTLVVPLNRYPNPARDKTTPTWSFECAVSTDGGVTFGPARKVADVFFGGYAEFSKRRAAGRIDEMSGVLLAAGPAGGAFADRLYAVWPDFREGAVPRVLLAHSADRGATWSKPRPVDAERPAGSSQYQPMLAVNREGTVGVLWYDTRGFPARDRHHVYFAASLDGGASFLPAVRVSSEPSTPAGSGNVRPSPLGSGPGKAYYDVNLYSAFSTWSNGGDYMGVAADAENVFHPLWADSRSGTYQLYTARIRVERRPEEKKTPRLAPAKLNDRVRLDYDPIRYDASRGEVAIPVRLRNDSKTPLYPPFRIEVRETIEPVLAEMNEAARASRPEILNASNGKAGVGAVFDYSKALGGLDALEPGAVTEAVVWRVKLEDPAKSTLHFGVDITGSVEAAEERR